VTHDQYKNFKKLEIIEKCNVIKENKKEYHEYKEEMQKAHRLGSKK